MGTLVISLGDFKVMFIVNTLGVLPPNTLWGISLSTLGVSAQVCLSTTPNTPEVLSQICMYPGGITTGITVTCMHAHAN